ncbi:MAG TPA: hypothetical protein VGS19_11800 [Streptosporangiaceae bacterium]|nr:hypothetical protein [Streptosporangiaceae bacterium]
MTGTRRGGDASTRPPNRNDTKPTRHTLTKADREKVRAAGAADARRSRLAAGLPERIEDPATIAMLAAMLREPATPGESTRDDRTKRGRKPAA